VPIDQKNRTNSGFATGPMVRGASGVL